MKTFIIILLLLNFTITFSQSPTWVWAKSAGGNSTDRSNSVFTDPSNGDVVVVGYYESFGITFGSITLSNTLNNYTSDIFVVKYSSSGNVIWAKTYGSTGNERANGVAIDANGNVMVTGHFDSPTIAFGAVTLTNTGGTDCFILKLNSAGNVVWAQQSNGNSGEYGHNIAVDNAGDIVVGGSFTSTSFSFGSIGGSLIGAGSYDIFVVKYNAAGVCQWLNVAGGDKLEDLQGIAVDNNNNVIISGGFTSAILSAGTSTLTNFQVNTYDAFIIKYSGTGTLSWITGIGGFYSESAMDVTTDNNNNIFITGYFESATLSIGSTILTNNTTSGFLDIYVAKLNSAGAPQWAKSFGGINDEYGSGVATDASGNVYVTGYFYSNTLSVGATTLINNGSFDIIIVKYSNTGTLMWAEGAGGGGSDRPMSVTVNYLDEVLISGYFGSSTISFGSSVITGTSGDDIFVVKLDNSTGLVDDNQPEWINIYSEGNSGQIHIKSQFPIIFVEITNAVGQRIISETPKSNEFSCQQRQPGIYFVKSVSHSKEVFRKIAVLR